MSKVNVLLICGGGGTEHDISIISANYIKSCLESINQFDIHFVEIKKDGSRENDKGEAVELRKGGFIFNIEKEQLTRLNFAIPCIHGPPGETGEIQAVFEMMKLPYLGCGPEASMTCFNKVTTKLWLNALSIPNTPFVFLDSNNQNNIEKALEFFKSHNDIYVKASSQGSSVGCFHVDDEGKLQESLNQAFKHSSYVLLEKSIQGRELEIAVYEDGTEVKASLPGEIICPDKFYDYEEKYSQESKTKTEVVAQNIESELQEKMKEYSIQAFKALKLRHLSRIDFFLTQDNQILLNEINTFPGMTPISMFPKMMENNGLKFTDYIKSIVLNDKRE